MPGRSETESDIDEAGRRNPALHRALRRAYRGVAPYAGAGRPDFEPAFLGEVAVDLDGRVYPAATRHIDFTTDPSFDESGTDAIQNMSAWSHWKGARPFTNTGILTAVNDVMFAAVLHGRWDVRENSFVTRIFSSWNDVVNWYRGRSGYSSIVASAPAGSIPAAPTPIPTFLNGPESVFLSHTAAAKYVIQHGVHNPTEKAFVYFTGEPGDESNWEFWFAPVGAFNAGVHVERDERYFREPLAFISEVIEEIEGTDQSDDPSAPTMVNNWVATSIDISAGRWMRVKPVGQTDYYWEYDLDELRDLEEGTADMASAADERFDLPLGSDNLRLGHESGLLLVSTSLVATWPTAFKVNIR